MTNIGEPLRRRTVVPLRHPVEPTREPQVAPPSREAPTEPVKAPEREPV